MATSNSSASFEPASDTDPPPIPTSTTLSSISPSETHSEGDDMSNEYASVVGGEYGSEGFPYRQVSHTGPSGSPKSAGKTSPLLAAARTKSLSAEVRKLLENADKSIAQGNHAGVIPLLETVIEKTDKPELHCLVWRLLGNAHFSIGSFKKASVCHLHNMAFCREMDDVPGVARANCNLGIAYMQLGAFKLAGRCFLQYLESSRILNDETGIASACSNLGVLTKTIATKDMETLQSEPSDVLEEIVKEQLYRAIQYFEEHLSIVEQHADFPKMARVYGNIGQCYQMLRQYPQAIYCFRKRVELARQLGDRLSEARALCGLGNCLRTTQVYDEARECYGENLQCSKEIGDVEGESIALLNLGNTSEAMQDFEKAVDWYKLYLAMMAEHNNLEGQLRAYSCLASLYTEMNLLKQSQDCFEKVAEISSQLGDSQTHQSAKMYANVAKKKYKSTRGLRGTLRRLTKGTLKAMDPSQGHRSLLYRSESIELQTQKGDSPMVKAKHRKSVPQGTWSPGLKRWYKTSPMPDWIPRQPAWEKSSPGNSSPLVTHNRKASAPEMFSRTPPHDDQPFAEVFRRIHSGGREAMPLEESQNSNPLFLEDLLLPGGVYDNPEDVFPTQEDTEAFVAENKAAKLTRADTIYSRVGTVHHAETLKRLTTDINRAPSELGFNDVSDEWKGWLTAQDENDQLYGELDEEMFEPKGSHWKKPQSPQYSPSTVPKSLDIFRPIVTPKCQDKESRPEDTSYQYQEHNL